MGELVGVSRDSDVLGLLLGAAALVQHEVFKLVVRLLAGAPVLLRGRCVALRINVELGVLREVIEAVGRRRLEFGRGVAVCALAVPQVGVEAGGTILHLCTGVGCRVVHIHAVNQPDGIEHAHRVRLGHAARIGSILAIDMEVAQRDDARRNLHRHGVTLPSVVVALRHLNDDVTQVGVRIDAAAHLAVVRPSAVTVVGGLECLAAVHEVVESLDLHVGT